MALPQFPANPDKPLAALGFDFGTQRIGIAFGQSLTGGAEPVCVLKARDGIPDWQQLGECIEQWQPDVFVIGLPYNMDGSESELLKRAVKFANRLHGRFHRPVYGMDERLSSQEAIEQVMVQGGNKESPIDHIAAQIILQNWFAELENQKKTASSK